MNKRYLWAIFATTEGEGAWYDSIEGITDDHKAALGEASFEDVYGKFTSQPSLLDTLEIPEEQREQYKDLTAEQVREKLQGPVAPEAYEFSLPEGVTEDAIDKDAYSGYTNGLAEIAKKHGLSQDAVAEIAQFTTKFDVDRSANAGPAAVENAKKVFSDELQAMKTEMGATKAQETITRAEKAITGFVTTGLLKILDDTGLRNSPDVILTFAKIGEAIGEDFVPNNKNGGDNTDSRDEKLKQLYPSSAK